MPARTVVVIGGAQSGPAAALAARETDPRARIVLLERGSAVNYAVGGLAYQLSGEAAGAGALEGDGAALRRDHGIDVRTGTAVSAIDARRRRVVLQDDAIHYTALVYALGAESLMPEVDGLADAGNVFRFRTPVDLAGIRGRLDAGAKRVVVLGGGFLGVEAADGLLRRGGHVTLVERGPALLGRFSTPLANLAAAELERRGATVIVDADVTGAEPRGTDVRTLRLRNGRTVDADLVVVATGLRPRTDLLAQAGARVDPHRAVLVDARAATSVRHVFACGVCVAVPHLVTKKPVWFAQAAQADRTAVVAGINAGGGRATMPGVVGSAVVRAGDLTLARTGLTAAEAAAFAGRRLGVVTVDTPGRDPWFAGTTPLTMTLWFDRARGRLLGAEVAGRAGVDKRVDVLATAIAGGLTVDRLARLDFAYAPPYSAPRDPVNALAAAAVALRGRRRATGAAR